MADDRSHLLSLRLKYGLHTIFILADPTAPFSSITTELLEILREQYPNGLLPSTEFKDMPPEANANVPIRIWDDVEVSYATPVNKPDGSIDWRDLGIKGSETPLSKGLDDNAMLAFAVHDKNEDDDEPEFIVQWPAYSQEGEPNVANGVNNEDREEDEEQDDDLSD